VHGHCSNTLEVQRCSGACFAAISLLRPRAGATHKMAVAAGMWCSSPTFVAASTNRRWCAAGRSAAEISRRDGVWALL